jgi:hypothetical protein
MGFMDKIKGLFKGREKQVKSGIDTVSNKVEDKVGPQHADKVDDASQKAKEAVDKMAGSDTAASPTTPGSPASAPAAEEPATPPPAAEPPAAPSS